MEHLVALRSLCLTLRLISEDCGWMLATFQAQRLLQEYEKLQLALFLVAGLMPCHSPAFSPSAAADKTLSRYLFTNTSVLRGQLILPPHLSLKHHLVSSLTEWALPCKAMAPGPGDILGSNSLPLIMGPFCAMHSKIWINMSTCHPLHPYPGQGKRLSLGGS